MRSRHVSVEINLDQVRHNAETIRRKTGVRLIAVIKADAYGLGAKAVAPALEGVADEFAYFTIDEARKVGRPGIVIGPPDAEPVEYRELGLRPMVYTRELAQRYASIPAAISLDTGMQRFGCRPEELEELLRITGSREVYTHAGQLASIAKLRAAVNGRRTAFMLHAASSALLGAPEAWLDAVRPGVALYRGAVRVSARIHTVRDTSGRVGYTGFECPRIGLILAGYSNLLGPAPVMINGRRQRLIEAGMNSSFVSLHPDDRAGDEVVLLGDGLTEAEIAASFNVREHEILCRYCAAGTRRYDSARSAPADGTIRSNASIPQRT